MEKIGLITLYEADNYGTCLQAFALQTAIETLGYQCDIINHMCKNSKNSFKGRAKRDKVKQILSGKNMAEIIDLLARKQFINKRKAAFSRFRKESLHITDNVYDTEHKLKEISDKYAAFICGSDMIWSEEDAPYFYVFFLQFTEGNKRIAYAPSIGQAVLTEKQRNVYGALIENFTSLSCREASAVSCIQSLTNKPVAFVLDPTLLLCKNQWINLLNIKKSKESCILCYSFRKNRRELEKLLKQIEHMTSLKTRWIPATYKEYLKEFKNGVYGPKEFAELFNQASFVVTDSYHGLLFSLIFKKPFIVLHRGSDEYWVKYEERMEAMLKTLHLKDRYIYVNTLFTRELLHLDYEPVTAKLNVLRESSWNYLKNSIQNVIDAIATVN